MESCKPWAIHKLTSLFIYPGDSIASRSVLRNIVLSHTIIYKNVFSPLTERKDYLALSPNPKDLVNVFAFADLDHVSFHIKHDTSKDLYLAFLEAH